MRFFRGHLLLTISLLLVPMPGVLEAQTRSNYSSSITSESMASIWIAKELNLFKKYGLETQYILMPRSPLAVAALMAGEIDMAVIGPGHLVNAGAGGADVIGVANLVQKLDYRLNTRPEIKRKEDLREKRIAISGPGATSHLVALVGSAKLGPGSESSKNNVSHDSRDGDQPPSRAREWHSRGHHAERFRGGHLRPKGLSGAVQFQRFRSDDAADDARHHPPRGR